MLCMRKYYRYYSKKCNKNQIKQVFGKNKLIINYEKDKKMNIIKEMKQISTEIEDNQHLPKFVRHLLPANYPNSVSKNYLNYTKWQMTAATVSAGIGVLSTQALLMAMGMGASTAIPAAVTLNWIIKDGLGQFGGVLFASWVSNRYDADPRRWRMIAAYALDTACLVEILTPLVPHLFLLIASLANIGKNIAWLSASATRAGINRSFAKTENLADVTAKSGSQTIASSAIGMGLGIGICSLVEVNTINMLITFSILSSIHIWSLYRSLKFVALPSLNQQRAEMLTLKYLEQMEKLNEEIHYDQIKLPTPNELRQEDYFMTSFKSKLNVQYDYDMKLNESFSTQQLNNALELFRNEKFIVRLDENRVYSQLLNDATNDDVLSCFLYCTKLRKSLQTKRLDNDKMKYNDLITNELKWLQKHRDHYITALQHAGWDTNNIMFDSNKIRLIFNT